MVPTYKKRIYWALAVVLLVWPLLHFGMVQTYHMNAWRFFGWAMYSVPYPVIYLSVFDDKGFEVDLNLPQNKKVADAFSADRVHYGDLLEPKELSSFLLSQNPAMKTVMVEVSTVFLDADTGSIKERKRRYIYGR